MTAEIQSLQNFLGADRPADSVVAFDAGVERTWDEFRGHVAALCDRLSASAARRWLVFSDDSYAFAVAITAVAQVQGVSVLPPNGQRGTLTRMSDVVDGFIIDDPLPIPGGEEKPVVAPLLQSTGQIQHFDPVDGNAPYVEFFTSGTTGENKCIAKRLRHLDDEVAVLEQVFGDRVDGSRFFATVSHQHIYGCLFRLLWPLASGRAFSSRTFLHGSEVAGGVVDGRSTLVSTPVQLKLMGEAGALEGRALNAVFSSGAPLDSDTAMRLARMVGTAPCEIFGSTETGGVAWRQRPEGGDQPWQPLPRVDVDVDDRGAIAVRSPFVSVAEDRPFTMGDQIEIAANGQFILRGRVDRVVKIGAKRLSLPDMEAEIARHAYVDEVALVVTRRGAEERVCAAAVLSESGGQALAARGRASVGRELIAALAPYYDRILLPRAWRFVDALPRNPQGKLPADHVRALFDCEDGAPVLEPATEWQKTSGDAVERGCTVPTDLAYLDGHFDSFPVVAGVVQLRWVITAVAEILGAQPKVASIEAVKFRQPLLPGDRFEMKVEVDAGLARFRLTKGEAEISSGRVKLA